MKKAYSDYCGPLVFGEEPLVDGKENLSEDKLHNRCTEVFEFSGEKTSYTGVQLRLVANRPSRGAGGNSSDDTDTEEDD